MAATFARMRTPLIVALVLLLALALALAVLIPTAGLSWASAPEDLNVAGASWSGPFTNSPFPGDFGVLGASWS